jgi:phage shock protein A
LRRAEDKVSGMRDKAAAMDGLVESGVLVDPLDNRPKEQRELDALRVGSAIDTDLEKLKAELAGKGAAGEHASGRGRARPAAPASTRFLRFAD